MWLGDKGRGCEVALELELELERGRAVVVVAVANNLSVAWTPASRLAVSPVFLLGLFGADVLVVVVDVAVFSPPLLPMLLVIPAVRLDFGILA